MLLYRDYLIFTQFPDLGGWRELESGANELQVGASLVIQTMSAIFLPRSRSFNQKQFLHFNTNKNELLISYSWRDSNPQSPAIVHY